MATPLPNTANLKGKIELTSMPASSRMAPIVDSVAALSRELILWRIDLRASFWYSRHSGLVIPAVTVNENVSMTAFRRALSSRPFRRTERKFWSTSSSETLKTGSTVCWNFPISKIYMSHCRTLGDFQSLTSVWQCPYVRGLRCQHLERIGWADSNGSWRCNKSFISFLLPRGWAMIISWA